MKVRTAAELPEEKLGQSELSGKILTSPQDNVGFAMYLASLDKGFHGKLVPLHEGHNHIYYCIKGKCVVILDDGLSTEFTMTEDTLLALPSSTKALITVHEAARLAIVTVPAGPGAQPNPFFLALDDIYGTDRDVDFSRGHSRRFLRQADGFNISVHNTRPDVTSSLMQYRNHIEANFFFKGRGTYKWNDCAESFEFDEKVPTKFDGVMYLLDDHDAHCMEIQEENSQLVCVFYPALKGDEVHNFKADSFSCF